MATPIAYTADRERAEAIMLKAAQLYAQEGDEMAETQKADLQARFGVDSIDLNSRTYWRITDNWLELSLRFVVGTHRIRGAKAAMKRHILTKFDKSTIGIALATYEIVCFPAVALQSDTRSG